MKGRKKIRHVIDEEDLEKGTKQAGKEEEERLKRIANRQKMVCRSFFQSKKGVVYISTSSGFLIFVFLYIPFPV